MSLGAFLLETLKSFLPASLTSHLSHVHSEVLFFSCLLGTLYLGVSIFPKIMDALYCYLLNRFYLLLIFTFSALSIPMIQKLDLLLLFHSS